MEYSNPLLAILSDESERGQALRLSNLLGFASCDIVQGTGYDAGNFIESNHLSPSYIAMFIGGRSESIPDELAHLSRYCASGTRVVVIGNTNDINFYRSLIEFGVTEYFTNPANLETVSKALFIDMGKSNAGNNSQVISFMSAAAGDGSSTISINTGYCLAKDYDAPTIVVDMDYQFGMISKNLDLSSPYGIKELFEHPDRGIDSTLIERMAISYGNKLDIIAAPNELKFQPNLRPEVIRDLILALKEKYTYILIDLPHIWSPWISAAFSNSDRILLASQLWLKSVTHATRLLNVWREMGINLNHVDMIINRSGAKFKEGINQRDFERVCGKSVSLFISNDIKTIVSAENAGKTVIELGSSKLGAEFQAVAAHIFGQKKSNSTVPSGSKFSLSSLKKKE